MIKFLKGRDDILGESPVPSEELQQDKRLPLYNLPCVCSVKVSPPPTSTVCGRDTAPAAAAAAAAAGRKPACWGCGCGGPAAVVQL